MGMTSKALRLIVVGLGLLVAAVAAEGSELDKTGLQKLYVDYLSAEGYRPEVDDDGDVVFKREGLTYFINVAEDDQEFFSVVLPNIWPIESETERAMVLAAADRANGKAKVSKVFTMDDDVWVATELFVARPGDFTGVFQRALSAIDTATDIFTGNMQE